MAEFLTKQETFLKGLLEHFHPKDGGEIFAKAFSVEKAKKIYGTDVVSQDLQFFLEDPKTVLEEVHYSWIARELTSFPKQLYESIILSFSEPQQKKLFEFLSLKSSNYKISFIAQKFLLKMIYKKLQGSQIPLPKKCFSSLPLFCLLDIDRKILIELFDFLGLYDLAAKVRIIVDKTVLANIEKSLSPLKFNFLKLLLEKFDYEPLPEIDLADWGGDRAKLQKLIHKRGMYRLSLALSGYPKDFLWYLIRKLDTGRGEIVLRYCPKQAVNLHSELTEQVLFIINLLTQKKQS